MVRSGDLRHRLRLMNMVMTAAPLAMKMCGLQLSDPNLGLNGTCSACTCRAFHRRSHRPFRRGASSRLGLALEIAAAIVDLSGQSVWHFWTGWRCSAWLNFAFIGLVDDRRLHRLQGAHEGPVLQRFHHLRDDGVGPPPADASRRRLEHGQLDRRFRWRRRRFVSAFLVASGACAAGASTAAEMPEMPGLFSLPDSLRP